MLCSLFHHLQACPSLYVIICIRVPSLHYIICMRVPSLYNIICMRVFSAWYSYLVIVALLSHFFVRKVCIAFILLLIIASAPSAHTLPRRCSIYQINAAFYYYQALLLSLHLMCSCVLLWSGAQQKSKRRISTPRSVKRFTPVFTCILRILIPTAVLTPLPLPLQAYTRAR